LSFPLIYLMLPPFVIILILGTCYSLTIAPDLTWAHFSADSGDLIVAAATEGVPHPSGYPLYLILARIFQSIPIGTLAFRTNLLSAVCTIAASLILYALLARQFRANPFGEAIATFSALAFGLAPFIWGQALVTEVYALHGLLIALCLYAISAQQPIISDWGFGLLFGLAATNHLTAIMLFPLLALDLDSKKLVPAKILQKRFAGLLFGLALYLTLPLRAYFDPPINWGDASTLNGFIWLVSGQIYHAYAFDLSTADMLERLGAFAGLLLEQFTWVGALLAIYGISTSPPRRISIPITWISLSYLVFSIIYASRDSQVNLLPVWICLVIWLAHGLQDIIIWLNDRVTVQKIIISVLFFALIARIPLTFVSVDASNDVRATEFIDQTLANVPLNSIIVVNGDEYIFSLWYTQIALGNRPDIVILAEGLLPYEWYIQSLRYTYPQINIPAQKDLHLFHLLAANHNLTVCRLSPENPLYCE
jgi:hypothetical protein